MRIERVTEADLGDLLPLLRGYCDFYEADTPEEALLALSRALLADPENDGIQLISRDDAGQAVGFATVYWTWSTLSASRLAVMNDLFVGEAARGTGLAEALIAACVDEARRTGATSLAWQTGKDNHRAQKVYDRIGAKRSQWVDYSLSVE